MAIQDEKLASGLMEDLAQARATAEKTSLGTGFSAPDDFDPKSLRIKSRVIGEKELNQSKVAITKLVDSLTFEASLLDEEKASVFRSKMKQKMNQYKMMLLRNASTIQEQMNKRRMDQKQQQAIWAGLGAAVGGVTQGVVANLYNSKQAKQLELTPDFELVPDVDSGGEI